MKKLLQKNYYFKLLNIFLVITLLFLGNASFSQQVSVTLSFGTTSWTPPTGVTSIQVEAWGGGGGGGGSTSSAGRAGGGGAGGSYVKYTNVTVTNTAYSITIGAGGVAGGSTGALANAGNGGNTTATFGSTTITAVGGIGGNGTSLGSNANNGLGAGAGGPSVAIGNSSGAAVSKYGGAGASAVASTRSGGGGGAAGELSNGGDASSSAINGGTYGGANATPYGTGANGNSTTSGSPGVLPGGGASGGYTTSTTSRVGGVGGAGQIIITYTPVTPTITLSASSLTGFNTSTNSPSTTQTINLSALNLTANISITSSTNFEISTSSSSGFGSSLTIPYGSGTVSTTPIYVRIKSGAPFGLLSESISFTSTGATLQSLICSGTVVTNYYYKGSGSLATLSNWGTNFDGTGANPLDFGSITNYQAFIIRNANTVETDASFTIGIVGTSTVNKLVIGDPTTTAVSLTISSLFPITFGTGTKLDINAANSGNNEVIFKNASASIPTLGSIDLSANITYANGTTGITGTPCNTLKITNNTTVTLASTPNCKYLIVDYGSSIIAASGFFITILSGGNAIINGSITGARSQGIFTTDALSKGTIYGVDLNTPITLGVNSTVIYNRSSAQTISPLNYANLTVTITGVGTLSANATLSGVLTVNAGATLNTGGFLTLKSDVSGTASVAPVLGTILGNATVERYIPSKRGWRALTAPVVGSTNNSVFYNWQNNGTAIANTGVEIWSNASSDSSITNAGNGSSMLTYNSAGDSWTPITNSSTASLFSSTVNNPFMLFVTGPYATTSTNITSGANATTLRATGTLLTGLQTYSSTAAQYTFIGNPYASPLNLSAMLADVDNAAFGTNIWVWDANVAGTNSVGTYNLFDSTASNYTNTTSNVGISGAQIQSGQAFFVKSTSGGTFSIKEAHKGATFSNAVFRDAAPAELLRVGLYKQIDTEWSGRDGAMTVITADAEANQTSNKMANGTENIAFTKNLELFASEHHLPLVASDVLNIRVWNTTIGANYKLKINTEQFSATNLNASLEDLYTNSRTPLTLDGSAIEYPFSVTTEATSTGNRFRIVFENSALGINILKASEIRILPNPIIGDSFQVNLGNLNSGIYSYSICNALGQEVENGTINNAIQNTNYTVKLKSNTTAGLYIMRVTGTDNVLFTAKLIKK